MQPLSAEQKLTRLANTIERQARMLRRENADNLKLIERIEKADARIEAMELIIAGLKQLPGANETLDAMKEQST